MQSRMDKKEVLPAFAQGGQKVRQTRMVMPESGIANVPSPFGTGGDPDQVLPDCNQREDLPRFPSLSSLSSSERQR